MQVIDINDNVPTFVYPESSRRYAKDAYYGAAAADKEIGSTVVQIRADDSDGGRLGDVRYELTDDDADRNNSTDGPYFSVDPQTGAVKTLRTLTDVPTRYLPFRLVVTARDNPGATNPADYNTAQSHVVVSVTLSLRGFEFFSAVASRSVCGGWVDGHCEVIYCSISSRLFHKKTEY